MMSDELHDLAFIPSGNSTRISFYESKIPSRQIVLVVQILKK